MAAQHFGVAHPPGYPLYVTAGYVWMKLMPFGNPAFKLNVLTSFIGGLAAFVVYLTTYKLVHFCWRITFLIMPWTFNLLFYLHSTYRMAKDYSNKSMFKTSWFLSSLFHRITKFIPSAVFASSVFGFSHLIWFHSVGAEIFSLNNLFCSLLLYWVVRFQQADASNRARVCYYINVVYILYIV